MNRRSIAVAAALELALSAAPVLRHSANREPSDYMPPNHTSHDAERIVKAEAKRARKAEKRAKQLETKK